MTELAELVRSGEVTSRELVEESLAADRRGRRRDQRLHLHRPRRRARGRRRGLERRRAPVRGRADRDQGPRRGRRRLAAHELLGPLRRLHAGLRQLRRAALPRGRLRLRRPDGVARVRDRAGHRAAPLRADAQPVGHEPHARRVLGRLRRGGRGRDGPDRARERRRRLDPDPGLVLRPRRA